MFSGAKVGRVDMAASVAATKRMLSARRMEGGAGRIGTGEVSDCVRSVR